MQQVMQGGRCQPGAALPARLPAQWCRAGDQPAVTFLADTEMADGCHEHEWVQRDRPVLLPTSVPPVHQPAHCISTDDQHMLGHACADVLSCCDHCQDKAAAGSCEVECDCILSTDSCLDLQHNKTQQQQQVV